MDGSEAWYVGLDCGHGFLTGAVGIEMPAPVVGDSEVCWECHKVRRIVETERVAGDWSPSVARLRGKAASGTPNGGRKPRETTNNQPPRF